MQLRRADGLAWVEIEGEVLVLERGSGELHLLDVPAAAVWRRLGAMGFDDLVVAVAHAFAADPEVVRADVEALVRGLRDRGLVHPSDD